MTAPHDEAQPDPAGGEVLDVVVVGGSQAGLAMAWHLAQQGLRFVVLEAGPELGHVWRSRWDSLKLFTPAQYDNLPGMVFPAPADTYPTKDPVADYLQATVEQLNGALLEKLGEDKLLGVGNLRVDTTVVEADIDHPPTPICWSRPSASSVGSPGGSRPAAPPAGPGFGTGRGRRGGDASSSPGPCGGGPGRPKGRLIGSPPRSPPRPADPDPGRAGGPGRPPRAARPTQRRPAWAAGRAAGGDDLGGQAAAGPDRPAPWGEPGDRRSAGCLERPGRPPDPQGQAGPADRVRRHGAAGRARTRLHRHPPHPQGQPARRWPAGGGQHRGDRADRPAAGHGGRRPRVRTAANDQALAALGVTRIGLARTGTPGKARLAWERTRAFRRMRNWRVGIQARSSHLKRSFGLRRTRLGRLGGARTWVGLGIFADNLQRMTVVAG
jgi:transposase, IS5 family